MLFRLPLPAAQKRIRLPKHKVSEPFSLLQAGVWGGALASGLFLRAVGSVKRRSPEDRASSHNDQRCFSNARPLLFGILSARVLQRCVISSTLLRLA